MSYLAATPDTGSSLTVPVPVRRAGMHLLGAGAVAAGGAFTGWVAAGRNRKGAALGALVHLALYGAGNALLGAGRLSTAERVVMGIGALGSAGAAFYLSGRR